MVQCFKSILCPMLDDSIEAKVKSTKVASEWGVN